MHKLILLSLILVASTHVHAEKRCSKLIKLRDVHMTEKRVEVVAIHEGVTYGRIIECLTLNSDQIGDLRFKTPTPELSGKKFARGQRIIISKHNYDPFNWVARYRYVSEAVDGDGDLSFTQHAHDVTLFRKLPLERGAYLDIGLGMRFSRAFIEAPEVYSQGENDFSAIGEARLRFLLPHENQISLGMELDRHLVVRGGVNDEAFFMRYLAGLGWEKVLFDQLTVGLSGGTNFMEGELSPGIQFGGELRYRIDNFHFGYRYRFLRVKTMNSNDEVHGHTASLSVEF